jgi:integrase
MGRKSTAGMPPGIHCDQHGVLWATLEGEEAKLWRQRYPGRSVPRRKAATLKAAVKHQRELIADLKSGRDPNSENPKIADLVKRFIDQKQRITDSTRQRYLASWRHQIAPFRVGRLHKLQVTQDHVREWVSELTRTPSQNDPEQMLDAYSIRNAFALLRAAFNAAGLVPNPCKGVELPEPKDEEIHPMEPEQIAVFLALVDSYEVNRATGETRPHRLAALYHVAIRCGPRVSELCGLRRNDIDLERRELRIRGQHKEGQRRRGKTRKAHRTVPFGHDLVAILRAHFANQASEQQIAGDDWNKNGLVFCSEDGTPLNASNVWRQFTALQRRCKLATPCAACNATGKQGTGKKATKCEECHGHRSVALFRVHDLRHTYAALAIAAGVDIFTLSRRMGHESITTTANTYGHLYKGQDDDAHAIDRLLRKKA